MTHKERKQRRRQIAEAIRNGDSVKQVCHDFSVTWNTVNNSCIEYGVVFPHGRTWETAVSSFGILKALLSGLSDAETAAEFNVSRLRIHQIRHLAISAGFAQLARTKSR